jgi:hypothetical protein
VKVTENGKIEEEGCVGAEAGVAVAEEVEEVGAWMIMMIVGVGEIMAVKIATIIGAVEAAALDTMMIIAVEGLEDIMTDMISLVVGMVGLHLTVDMEKVQDTVFHQDIHHHLLLVYVFSFFVFID